MHIYKGSLLQHAFDSIWSGISITSIDEAITNYIAGRSEDLFYWQCMLNNHVHEDYSYYVDSTAHRDLCRKADKLVRQAFEDHVTDSYDWPLYRIFVSFYIQEWERTTEFKDYFYTIAHAIADGIAADLYKDYLKQEEGDGK